MTAISLEHSDTTPTPAPTPDKSKGKMPSGWYILPCVVIGSVLWYLIIDVSIGILSKAAAVSGG
jgi:hypothetical protein